MRYLQITEERLLEGTRILQQGEKAVTLQLPAQGGGILLPELSGCRER